MRAMIAAQLVQMSVQHHAPVAWPRQTVNELERLGSAYTHCRWGYLTVHHVPTAVLLSPYARPGAEALSPERKEDDRLNYLPR